MIPISAMSLMASMGSIQPSRLGPSTTPANNSPMTEGALSLAASSAKTRAVKRIISRIRKKSWLCIEVLSSLSSITRDHRHSGFDLYYMQLLENSLLDQIPASFNHARGRMKFGPDKKLYITTGDAGNGNSAQDLNSLAGKILRINSDGTIPDDNPFGNTPVYSYGHRNPQGLDWDPVTGKLVVTEHGPSAHDEVNVVEAGKNYGWPIVIGGEHEPKYVDPIIHTGDDTWAPSGASFYNSDNIPDWKGKYFIATLRGNHLRMLDLDLDNNKVISSEALFKNSFGRIRDASLGPDGNMYLLTSNRDGRGSPAENDDRILRIIQFPIPLEKVLGDASLSPLKQLATGILPNDVACKSGLELLIKSSNGAPACVTPATASKLVLRGWGMRI